MKKFLIKVEGKQYEVEVEEIKKDTANKPAGNSVVSSADYGAQKAQSSGQQEEDREGETAIKAPMPGTVLKVNVKEGDEVKKGQSLLLLEAMKMENDITAPVDGKVLQVKVNKGSSVNAGDVMISIG